MTREHAMTDEQALELLAARWRHPARRQPPPGDYEYMSKADKRARLLTELAQINAAMQRHDAVIDISVEDAANLRLPDLKVIVEAAGHRLADIIKATSW